MCSGKSSCKDTYSSGPHQLLMKKPVCRSSKDSTLIMTGEYNSALTCLVGKCSCEDERPWEGHSSSHHVFKSHSLSQWDSLGMLLLLKSSSSQGDLFELEHKLFSEPLAWEFYSATMNRTDIARPETQQLKKYYQKHTWKAVCSSTQTSDH